jgi:hypothetical protein
MKRRAVMKRTRRARANGSAESPKSNASSPRMQDTVEPVPNATVGTSEDTAARSRDAVDNEAAAVPPEQPPSPRSAWQLRIERLALKLREDLLDCSRSHRECLELHKGALGEFNKNRAKYDAAGLRARYLVAQTVLHVDQRRADAEFSLREAAFNRLTDAYTNITYTGYTPMPHRDHRHADEIDAHQCDSNYANRSQVAFSIHTVYVAQGHTSAEKVCKLNKFTNIKLETAVVGTNPVAARARIGTGITVYWDVACTVGEVQYMSVAFRLSTKQRVF